MVSLHHRFSLDSFLAPCSEAFFSPRFQQKQDVEHQGQWLRCGMTILILVCALTFVLPVPLNSCLLCSHPLFRNSSPLLTSFLSVQFIFSLSLSLPHPSYINKVYIFATMNCSLKIINLAPAGSFSVIFIGILMLLRAVMQSITGVSALPKCVFSTYPFSDRAHIY